MPMSQLPSLALLHACTAATRIHWEYMCLSSTHTHTHTHTHTTQTHTPSAGECALIRIMMTHSTLILPSVPAGMPADFTQSRVLYPVPIPK